MDEASERTILVQIGVEDYVAAQRLHTRWTRKRVLISLCAAVAGAVLLLLDQPWSFIAGCGLIGGVAGGTVAFEIARRYQIPRRARRLFAQQKNLQRPLTFSWDDEGLSWTSANGSGKTPWVDYLKWGQDERLFLLYHSDAMFQMLPKRAFVTAAQLQSFASCLERIPA